MSAADRRLAARASRGDVEAFGRLFRKHSGLVHRVALRTLGGKDAQDASQEVWIRVWSNMKNFRGDSTFSTWLYRIAVNTCLSFRRGKSRREAREVGEEISFLPEPVGGDANPEEAVLGSERREEVRMALGNVRAEHRTALVLRHIEDLSYAEIAEVLGVPGGTAKGWASRGRAAMLAALVPALARERTPGGMVEKNAREWRAKGTPCHQRARGRVDTNGGQATGTRGTGDA